jgi:methionine-S-sulfoxide reductase
MTKKIVLAGGCFWGLENLLRKQTGVIGTEVGYTGGTNEHPTYERHPGHAEAVEVTYDDTITSYKKLLDFFFRYIIPQHLTNRVMIRGHHTEAQSFLLPRKKSRSQKR